MKNYSIFLLLVLFIQTLNAEVTLESIQIPKNVDGEIKQRASNKWPNDYEMQLFTVKNQRRAYKQMAYYSKKYSAEVPAYREMVVYAMKKWPNDYEMQWFTVKNQLSAYIELHGSN